MSAVIDTTTNKIPSIAQQFPRHNMWITLAQKLNRTDFCISLSRPDSPFYTCLIGVPLNNSEAFLLTSTITGQIKKSKCNNSIRTCLTEYDMWDDSLPYGTKPDELEILGTLHAEACLYINSSKYPCNEGSHTWCNLTFSTNISPQSTQWNNGSFWCKNITRDSMNPAPGTTFPRLLPPGIFLICGDRAFNGIPQRPIGGPCTFGRLTIALPTKEAIIMASKNISHVTTRRRRSTLDSSCNDNVQIFNRAEQVAASLFLPGLAAGHALFELEKLMCWVNKQANATSEILSSLATDLDTVRHATLQNRAAIDFLLLAHGHGCEDFEGMCCMNLANDSESIHRKIQLL